MLCIVGPDRRVLAANPAFQWWRSATNEGARIAGVPIPFHDDDRAAVDEAAAAPRRANGTFWS
jgi:hypothetical protein